jgi:hypothetical protein
MLVGEKIKKAIDRTGWDPVKVAGAINMSTANLYRIFKRDSVETKYLVRLSDLLHLPLSYFYEEGYTIDNFVNEAGESVQNMSVGERPLLYTKAELKSELEKATFKIDMLEQRLRDKDEIIELLRGRR